MKIKFDFLKSDEKDRLKLKKIDSKDILYIEFFENSLLFKFVKGKEFKIYLNIKNYDRKLKKNNSFLEIELKKQDKLQNALSKVEKEILDVDKFNMSTSELTKLENLLIMKEKFINEYNLNIKNITFNTYEIGVNLEKKLNEFLKEFKNSFDILILGRNRIRKTYFTNYEVEYIKKIINNKEAE
jgi:hypothetical protein